MVNFKIVPIMKGAIRIIGQGPSVKILRAALIAFLASACVAFPTPGHNLMGSMAVVSSDKVADFTAHETDRADVLLTLGRPSESRANDRFFIYIGRDVEGYLLVYGSPPAPIGRWRMLVIEFSTEDRFLRHKEFAEISLKNLWMEGDAWMIGKQTQKTIRGIPNRTQLKLLNITSVTRAHRI